MITYPIADNKQPNRFYYGIGTYVSTDPQDKGIILSLKDSFLLKEVRAYIPVNQLDELIANLLKYKKEL